MKTRLAFCLFPILLAASRATHAATDDSGSTAPAHSNTKVTSAWMGFAAQGLAFGRGQPSANGLHATDSLSLTAKQGLGDDKFSETWDGSTDAKAAAGKFQESETGLACKYKRGGFTATLDGALDYSTVLFDKRTRAAKVKQQAVLYKDFGGDVKQKVVLDKDSNWEWTSNAGYADQGGQFRTWDFASSLADDLGDFDLSGEVDGFREAAAQDPAPCAAKPGKSCATQPSTSIVKGIGLAAGGDWNPDTHLLAVHAEWDWQSAQTVQRILTLSGGYTYSPVGWLDLSAGFTREENLDLKKKAVFWQAASAVDAHF